MKKNHKNHAQKSSSALNVTAVNKVSEIAPIITVFEYTSQQCTEKIIYSHEISNYKPPSNAKIWLNVHGINDAAIIKEIGQLFNLHPLVVESIQNKNQRPKLDAYDEYVFLETNNFYYDQAELTISSEQISIVLGKNFILSFQERITGSFNHIRERLRVEHSQMRMLGSDYLAYAILDAVVDKYFGILEQMGDDCETLEEVLLNSPSNNLHILHQLKRASIELRRSVWPLREIVNHLTRNENEFLSAITLPYMRDVYDHIVHFIESLEAQRDMLSGMMDIYLSTMSNRVNLEVRALTVVAMLFMPATLIAGIFGMNFHEMPWLAEKNGFWWAMSLMGGIALVMILIFWRRQWLSSKS